MATIAGKSNVRDLIVLLGLSIVSYVVEGSLENHQHGDHARRSLADANAAVFDVVTFGAKADDKTDNFEPFVKAWKAACSASGPATILIPEGTFVAGPMVFEGPCKSPLTIEVRGTIKATTDISQYSSGEWFLFENIDGLTITGKGTFDGQGASSWQYNDCKKNANCQLLATSLKFNKVKNVLVSGISSLNAQSFHIFLTNSDHATFHDVNVIAPADSPNTDGIHLSKSSFVNITNSKIGTGDDCISMVQGTTNVTISNVFCGPGHGISIGSLGKYQGEQDVSDIVVTNCTLSKTDNGVRIKTWGGSPPSKASNMFFEDIIMDTVENPIIIDQEYGTNKGKPSQVKISNVRYKNIRGTSISNVAVALQCSPTAPCEGVELVDVDLAFNGNSKKGSTLSASCLNAKFTSSGKQTPGCA